MLQDTGSQAAGWVVCYCRALWEHISHSYGSVEAGQVLGYHFTEAAQVSLCLSNLFSIAGAVA